MQHLLDEAHPEYNYSTEDLFLFLSPSILKLISASFVVFVRIIVFIYFEHK